MKGKDIIVGLDNHVKGAARMPICWLVMSGAEHGTTIMY